jgi:hypothetical protein
MWGVLVRQSVSPLAVLQYSSLSYVDLLKVQGCRNTRKDILCTGSSWGLGYFRQPLQEACCDQAYEISVCW